MQESIPLLVAVLSFGAVSALAFVVGQYVWVQSRIQRRLSGPAHTHVVAKPRRPKALDAFITKHFDEKRFGVDETLRGKLRRELVKAGYFRNDAINYYIFARLAVVIVLPVFCYVAIEAFVDNLGWYFKLLIVSIAALLAIIGPDAYLARRQRM